MRNDWRVYDLLFTFHLECLTYQRYVVVCVLILCGCIQGRSVWAEVDTTEYVQAIEQDIQRLQVLEQSNPGDPGILTELSGLFLKLGGASQDSNEQRILIYEEGVRLAKQALAREKNLADAHFYYAANLGSATQLEGVMASALVVEELKLHAKRAVELQSDHAPALHMLGRMFDELPWFLGGDQETALRYLKQAVLADEYDAHAHLDLAKMYIERRNIAAAIDELQKIIQSPPLQENWSWRYQYKPEAERILKELKNAGT